MSIDGEPSLKELARAERADLAAFLAELTPEQWRHPSLCSRWTVKDVVAHVVSYEELSVGGLLKRFAKGWVVNANQVGVDEFAGFSPDELVAYLNRHLYPSGLTAGFGGMIGFVDATVHHQDIRRALNRPRTIPADRLGRILPLIPGNPRLGAGRRIRGLRLHATDVDWSHGHGAEVIGPGEALMMVMTGRRAALADLDGTGKSTLAQRL
ncbi:MULTISPECIES: maleylpyruvate isomerase family mycothiol-dependent enzyme [unclassified Mycobacterium]|uniref:maleylpyruvate isomerase family mycothiol-dependent enzyme n=1 Tax=unclassified Mycobacterium TaxID=2642494 RepID=UPI0007402BE5|nr:MULTISPECIES: maleylpyruvate isomerase family mycothiol-dependent enzyme [unclassified Mycobacterium]KUH80444.1 DinB family protein [Mycobacterium sp. GA-1999]KUH89135.1 DinB family protein [Mycobacterium sp. GA-0227b]KUH95869.1 DinB family protein [Mycobacterium sp. IS-1556]